MENLFDVIILGCGISGLTSAIILKETGANVVVFTKSDNIRQTSTYYAQGGIVASKPDDSPEQLLNDILDAGVHFNNKDYVKEFSKKAPSLVFEFLINKLGIQFSTDNHNNLDYTEEAAHSTRRILHYSDHTGEQIQNALIAYAQKIGIKIFQSYTAVDLITNNHHSKDTQEHYKNREVMGVYLLNNQTSIIETYLSHTVILATGGLGNLYQYSTNPPSATGDGMSMAYRAGADIINAEFIQFHPTCLYHKDIKRFLISESLRGEGAKLIDHNGNEFMHKYSDKKELAPRDVVSRAIYEEIYNSGQDYLYLDICNHYQGEVPLQERFSRIYQTCLKGGIDITRSPIPIVPASHYFCGGIKVNDKGQTNIKNLYAIGEISCSGLHGANRLASISLLEGLYNGKLSADSIIHKLQKTKGTISLKRLKNIPDWERPNNQVDFDPILINQDWKVIKLTMWNYAGIIRTKKGLYRANADLNYYEHRIFKFYKEAKLDRNIIELRNAVVNAQIIVHSALQNNRSIGCHYLKEG